MLPPVDVRRKRPPALSFLLRMETLRRGSRVVSLLALDFAGLLAALVVALMVKAVLRDGVWAWEESIHEARRTIAFAYLVTVLLFARSGLYAERAQRPGIARIVSSLFQVTVVSLIFAVVNNQDYSSYYIFYGTFVFAVAILGSARWLYEKVTGAILRAAGYRRRAVLVGSGRHIEDVAHALTDEVHAPVEMVGFVSLTPRPDNGLRSLGRIEDMARVLDVYRVQEVIIADPDFPQELAVDLVDTCHQRGVTVRVAPSTMEILVQRAEFVPGASVPLFELRPPVFDGVDFFVKRTFDLVVSALPAARALAAADADRARGAAVLARAGHLPLLPAGDRRRVVRVPEVPHDVLRRRRAPAGPRIAQRGLGRAVQDPPGPAPDARRARPAPLLARRAPAARSTCCAGRCRSSGRGRCRSATSSSSRTGTRSATSCCRA